MAPEQLFGERDIDQQADVWALGVILYECLAGRRPTEAENIGQILRILTADAIEPLRMVAPSLPDDLTGLVDRMLQRDRVSRPRSLVEAFSILRRHAPRVTAGTFAEPAVVASSPSYASLPPERSVVSHDGDASPTAATLASTTGSTTADRIPGLRSRRRSAFGLVAAAVLVGVATGGAVIAVAARSPSVDTSASAATVVASPLVAPPPPIVTSTPAVAPAAPPSAGSLAAVVASGPPAPHRPRTDAPPPRPAASPATPPTPSPQTPTKPSPYEHM
jgi:serine/threonine-protein kinase